MKIYVAGEGRHELGRWEEARERRATSKRTDGVLVALFRRSGHTGEVIDGKSWKNIRKFQAGEHATPEQRTLQGLALEAEEAGADLILWARDSDHEIDREQELHSMQTELRSQYGESLTICGGVATPAIEAWMIALAKKHPQPDTLPTAKSVELANLHGFATEQQMVDLINDRPLDAQLSPSLKNWLAQLDLIPSDG